MEFRVGTCTSCNKKFKVPATFQADKAKCKHCGGVVEVEALASSAQPKAKPAAEPVPVPAKKAAAPMPARPAVASAGAKTAGTDSVRAKARAAGQRVKASGTKAAAPLAKARAEAGAKAGVKAGAGARASARTGSRSSSGGSSRRSRAKPAPKKSNVGMIVGIVVLIAAVGAGAFFMLKDGGDNATQAAETNVAQANPLDNEAPDEAAAPVDPEPESSDPLETEKPTEPDPEPEAPAQPKEVVLLDLIEELPDLEPLPGTDPERAQELRQWMAEYIDPNAGAAGSRAGKALQEAPKEAFPFIINAFKRIDTTTEDGFRAGDLTQKLLERICNGNNFDWKYPAPGSETLERKDVLYNQKVVRAWHTEWLKCKDDEARWLKLTKQAAQPEETKQAPKLDDF
jgi:hypothetical protein